MAIKSVIFDLDGTLLNTLSDLANAANHMLEHFGYEQHDIQSYKFRVGNGMRKLMERSMPENHRTAEEIQVALDYFMPYYNAHSLDNTVPYSGVSEVVEKIRSRGIKTAVVTNKTEASAVYILKKFFGDSFDIIVGQRENMPTKPNPAGTRIAMQLMGVAPEQCLFVGDSGVDILTGKNSGAHPVGVLWGFRGESELIDAGAEKVIDNPQELIEIIDSIK